MSKFLKIYFTSAVTLLLGTTAGFAEITNADVWKNWQGYMISMGYEVSANESVSGNLLKITDVKMKMDFALGNDSMNATIPEIQFTKQGDGSVRITIPEKTIFEVDLTLESGEAVNASIGYSQDDLNMVVTGDPDNFNYAYSANALDITLDNLTVDDEPIGPDFARANVSLENVNGNSTISNSELWEYTQSGSIGLITYDVAFSDSENGGTIKMDGELQKLASNSIGSIPNTGMKAQDVAAMLDAGFAVSGTAAYQAGNMDIAFDGPDGAGTATTSSTGGEIVFTMDGNGLRYSVGQDNLAINALMPDVPFPITLNMATSRFNVAMPLRKSDDEQVFAFGFTMGDLTVSEMLWSMFDPAANLPRNPATLAVDLSGKAKVLFDLFDPDQAAALESSGAAPGELTALSLNSLIVDAVGARLTATGDFTFDNTDLVSFEGMPRPTGGVDLKLVGGNGLLDNLVNMGTLPEQQAMGARMMMGLFARAGTEPDTVTSKIEINDAGHILANGQRIQ
jgi:hypothetical protein